MRQLLRRRLERQAVLIKGCVPKPKVDGARTHCKPGLSDTVDNVFKLFLTGAARSMQASKTSRPQRREANSSCTMRQKSDSMPYD